MDIKLRNSEAKRLRDSFYELLQDFTTFPAASNFFLVNIQNLPENLTEEYVNKTGLRANTNGPIGLDKSKDVFKKLINGYMFLVDGVDLTVEKAFAASESNNSGINGLLPVGPFMTGRRYPDTDLNIQFSESNISFVDSIIRPWIQLYSVYGDLEDINLRTDVTVFFLSKQQITSRKSFSSVLFGSPGADAPVVRKIYEYKNCIPYEIQSANQAQYTDQMDLKSVSTSWRFSKYDVITPYT